MVVSGSAALSGRQFFHGSNHELKPGDKIEPAAKTGTPNWAARVGQPDADLGPYSPQHVYHSSEPHDARVFGEHVYEVRPTADWRVDPEDAYHQTGIRWTRSKRATVVRKL